MRPVGGARETLDFHRLSLHRSAGCSRLSSWRKVKGHLREGGWSLMAFVSGLVLASLYGVTALFLQKQPLWFCVHSTLAVAFLAAFGMGLSAGVRADVAVMLPSLCSGQSVTSLHQPACLRPYMSSFQSVLQTGGVEFKDMALMKDTIKVPYGKRRIQCFWSQIQFSIYTYQYFGLCPIPAELMTFPPNRSGVSNGGVAFVSLSQPLFFCVSGHGRSFLLFLFVSVLLSGPLTNTLENTERAAASLLCGAELAANRTQELTQRAAAPLFCKSRPL